MKLIKRPLYLNQLLSVRNTPDIKVITGIRRCGKSKLLESYIDSVREEFPDTNIIHINLALLENEPLLEYHKLHEFVGQKYKENCNNMLIIDEIQMCSGFELAVNSLHDSGKYDIYITGSNAFLMSSDLATLFTGRTFPINVYPFSFEEFCSYYELKPTHESFKKYFEEGGFAGSFVYSRQTDKMNYVKEVFNTLIVRDINQKYKVENENMLNRLTDYLSDNVSTETSARKISAFLTSNEIKTNHVTISKYIDALCSAFAFYRFRRYDINGKRYLTTQEKYYLADHSLKYARLGTKTINLGRVLENIVAIELLRRGYEVYTGVLYNKEIDFVAINSKEKLYIQVSESIEQKETLEREVKPLLSIRDAYPKILITNTHWDTFDYEGIQIFDFCNWLTKTNA